MESSGRMIRTFLISMSALVPDFCVLAQNTSVGADTLRRQIEEVTVRGGMSHSLMQTKDGGEVQMDIRLLDDLPKILGNADPMHYMQTWSGVQTNNEYDGGLHILGCDNTHNLVGIDGVPIYNVNHLLGIFSVFNPTHFQQMSISKTATRSSFPNRLGGMATMGHAFSRINTEESVTGSVDVGLISSQGTLCLPIGKNSVLTLSGRGCYLNQLYGYALKFDNSQLSYTFGDVNATWFYTPDSTNTLWFEAYWGGDRATLKENSYQAESQLRWGNTMMSLHWRKDNKIEHTFYYTESHSNLDVDQQVQLKMPASIRDFGYKGYWQNRWLKTGVDVVIHSILPSVPSVRGLSEGDATLANMASHDERQTFRELAVYADGNIPLGISLMAIPGLRLTTFLDNEKKSYYAADPSLTIRYVNSGWRLTLTASSRHQYVWQTGFSSLGLPTENWAAVDDMHRPMRGLSVLSSISRSFLGDELRLLVELYGKQLRHLNEHDGTLLDLLLAGMGSTDVISATEIEDVLTATGRGETYGVGITVEKPHGRLKGWLCYNISRSRRQFNEAYGGGWYAANHERMHELNIVATWQVGRRWGLSGTFVWASGTPFTMPEQVYVYSGQLLARYSAHNAYRLRPYSRLDLSANYRLAIRGGREHGINLSVYNVLGQENELFYAWHVFSDGNYVFRPVSFLLKIIPSVSYYAKF